jgi:flagellar biogenesis protein FliO
MALASAAAAQQRGQALPNTQSQQDLASGGDPLAEDGANAQAPDTSSQPSAWRAFTSLVFVLAIAGGGVWALKKWGIKRLPGTGGTRLKVEETLALGERRFVSILKVDDERFLIASYPQGLGLLARLDGSVEPGFGPALEQQMNIQAPIPVRDMEAKLRGEQL